MTQERQEKELRSVKAEIERLIEKWQWRAGIAGNANIVRFDGDDIVPVARTPEATDIIAAHNYALKSALSALIAEAPSQPISCAHEHDVERLEKTGDTRVDDTQYPGNPLATAASNEVGPTTARPKEPHGPIRRCQSSHACCMCDQSIALGQQYIDGGYGKRAHYPACPRGARMASPRSAPATAEEQT